MTSRIYYDPICLEHLTGEHPESPARLEVILSHLQANFGETLEFFRPRKATLEEAGLCHRQEYLEQLIRLCDAGGGILDEDTVASARSLDAALHGVGALLDSADAIMSGQARSTFALTRPPGHHARPGAAMGFCLLNQIAVAAAYLQQKYGVRQLLIVDFDVHHGNGTQEIFYEDESVFFLSMHRYPFWPGTGSAQEQGRGPGLGKTRNLPITLGTPADRIVEIFRDVLAGACSSHRSEALLISAGFDAHEDDPVGGLGLKAEHYTQLGRAVRAAAAKYCQNRLLTTLEGGYGLQALPSCVGAYLLGLA